MINLQSLPTILSLLIKDEEVFNMFQNDFPEILADLITYKNNPNCSCKSRVVKFFTEQLQQNPEILLKYIKDEAALVSELNKLEGIKQQLNYSGKIITIPKDEASWKNFAKECNGKIFKSFSIVEKENELVIYIL